MALVHGIKPIVTSGLVICLDAANRKSYPTTGTTWTDLSGNGNNGTLTNMDGANFDSANGGSLTFNGSDERVNLGLTSLSSTLSGLTISLFAKISKLNSKQAFISSYTPSPQGGWGVEFLSNNKINWFGLTDTTTVTGIVSIQTLSLNQLVNITCVYGSSTFLIYVNGNLDASTSGVSTIYKTSNIHIGNANISSPAELFQGNISQVSIYNRALSATEVAQNFNALKSRYINLPVPSIVTDGLQLHLDAGNPASYPGSGNTWTDLSGNGRTGTLNGAEYNPANGGSITFDGTDDYVSSTLPALTSYTTSAWVRLRIPNTAEWQLLQTFNDGFGMSVLTNKFFTYNGGTNFGQTVANDVWYNWVVTSTNTPSNSTKIIINTIVDGTFSTYGAISSGAIALAGYVGQSRYLNADISSFMVYNRVLSTAEIAQNFNALKGRYGFL